MLYVLTEIGIILNMYSGHWQSENIKKTTQFAVTLPFSVVSKPNSLLDVLPIALVIVNGAWY